MTPSAETEIPPLAEAWMQAWVRRDRATCEALLADDFLLTSARGVLMPKAEWLEAAMGPFVCTAFAWEDLRVRAFGTLAIVHGRARQQASVAGQNWSGVFLLTDAWAWRDGRWQVVSRHGTGPLHDDAPPRQGPARAGLFLYAKDLARVAAFYEALLGLRRLHASPQLVVLDGDGVQLVVHAIPDDIARGIDIAHPPVPRDRAALKFFFAVPSLADAHTRAPALGGQVLDVEYRGPGFRARNAVDPEGNLFHLREFDA